jgi:hypothetical protein
MKKERRMKGEGTGSLIINGINQVLRFNGQLKGSQGNRKAKLFEASIFNTLSFPTPIPTEKDMLKEGHSIDFRS